MSKSGGLLQLVAKNEFDNKLTKEPEINPFLKTFKKYSNFSIDSDLKYIGNIKLDNKFSVNIGNNGDLLGNMNMILKIPKKYTKSNDNIINQTTNVKDYITFTMFNTEYYMKIIDDDTMYLIPINYRNEEGYKLKDFYIETEENNIILNKIKSYSDVRIYYHPDNIINEMSKFNTLYEKSLLKLVKNKNLSTKKEFIDKYADFLEKHFIDEYEFSNNISYHNSLFKIDERLSLNYYLNNMDSNELKYDTSIILNVLMSLNNYNNQRNQLEIQFYYNITSGEFTLQDNDVISLLIWSKYENNNLNEITKDNISTELYNYHTSHYYETFENIINKIESIELLDKFNSINNLGYYKLFIDKLFIDLKLNDTLNFKNNNSFTPSEEIFMKQNMNYKLNLAYQLLNNIDNIYNNTKINNIYPLLIFKRILASYLYLREINTTERKINNFKSDVIDEVVVDDTFIKANFTCNIDNTYPINKEYIRNEMNKLKYNKHYIISHNKLDDNILKQTVTIDVIILPSDINEFNYMIELGDFIFLKHYSYKINNKPIISLIKNKKIYFNTNEILNNSSFHKLTIYNTVEFFDITNFVNSLEENNHVDSNGIRTIFLKKNNHFINKNTFILNVKSSSYDGNNIIKINKNVLDLYNVILETSYLGIIKRIKMEENTMIYDNTNLSYNIILEDFNYDNFTDIKLILFTKNEITITIDEMTTTSNTTEITLDIIKGKMLDYLLTYYNFDELDKMMSNYNGINNYSYSKIDFTISSLINQLNNFIDYRYININTIGNIIYSQDYTYEYESNKIIFSEKIISDIVFKIKSYYPNILNLTSETINNTKNYYITDFITYHPMIITIDTNTSILLNCGDIEMFDDNIMSNNNIILVDNILSENIFKEYSSTNGIIFKSMTLNLDVDKFIDELYDDNMNKISDIEDSININYLSFLSKILMGEFGKYKQSILLELLEKNIHNLLFSQRSFYNNSSIYRFLESEHYGTDDIDITNNTEIIIYMLSNMTNNVFDYRKINIMDFEAMKNIGNYLFDKYNNIVENHDSIKLISSKNNINSMITDVDKKEHLLNIVSEKGNEIYLHPSIFKEEYIYKKNISNSFESYDNNKSDNLITKSNPILYCQKTIDGIQHIYPTKVELLENQTIVEKNSFHTSKSIIVEPIIVNYLTINSMVDIPSGYLIFINIKETITDINSLLHRFIYIYNGINTYRVYVANIIDNTLHIYSLFHIILHQIICIYISTDDNIINFENITNDNFISDNNYLLNSQVYHYHVMEVNNIISFNKVVKDVNSGIVLDSFKYMIKNSGNETDYYFVDSDNVLEYISTIENLPPVKYINDEYFIFSNTIKDNTIYYIPEKDLYFDNRIDNLPIGNYIVVEIPVVKIVLEKNVMESEKHTILCYNGNIFNLLSNITFDITFEYYKILNPLVNKVIKRKIDDNIIKNKYVVDGNTYNVINDTIVLNSDKIILVKEKIQRTLFIRKYNSIIKINGNDTNILNFISETEEFTLTIENYGIIQDLSNVIIKSNILETIKSDDSLSIKIKLKEIQSVLKENIVEFDFDNEIFYLSVYYNTSNMDMINISVSTVGEITSLVTHSIDEFSNIITFDMIKNGLINLNGNNIFVYNFPVIHDELYVKDGYLEITDTDIVEYMMNPYMNTNGGYYVKCNGYSIINENKLYIYCTNDDIKPILTEGMKIMINDTLYIVLNVYGKIAEIESKEKKYTNFTFKGFIDMGIEYCSMVDYDMNTFYVKYDDKTTNILNMFNYKFKEDLYISSLLGKIYDEYSMIYMIDTNNNTKPKSTITLKDNTGSNIIIPNLMFNEEIMLLDENMNIIGFSFISTNDNFSYNIDYNIKAKYIVVNGNNIKHRELYFNSREIDFSTRTIEIDRINSITMGTFIESLEQFRVNRYKIDIVDEFNEFINSDIFKELIFNYENNDNIFLANDMVKTYISINIESMKEEIKNVLNYRIDDNNVIYLNPIDNTDININDINFETMKILLSTLRDSIDFTKLNVKLRILNKYDIYGDNEQDILDLYFLNRDKSNLNNFLIEKYDKNYFNHLVRIRRNKIISKLYIENPEKICNLNGIFKVVIKDNIIQFYESDCRIEEYFNVGDKSEIIYKIPLNFTNQYYDDNIFMTLYTLPEEIKDSNILNYEIYGDSKQQLKLNNNIEFIYSNNVNTIINFGNKNIQLNETVYKIQTNSSVVYSHFYVKVINQLKGYEKINTDKYVNDSFINTIYYTNYIENITKENIINTYYINTKYSDLIFNDMPSNFIRVNNKIVSEEVLSNLSNNKILIEGIDDYKEIDSGNIHFNTLNTIDDDFYLDLLNKNDIVNLVDYNIFLEDCIDKETFYSLNNNIITNKLSKFNDSYFTIKQKEYIDMIGNTDNYILFTDIVENILEYVKNNFNIITIKNYQTIIKNVIINWIYNNSTLNENDITFENNRLIIDGDDYSDITLSIYWDDNDNVKQDLDSNNIFSLHQYLSKLEEYNNIISDGINYLNTRLRNNTLVSFKDSDIFKLLQYSKYGKNYNQQYLEDMSGNIYKFNLSVKDINQDYIIKIKDTIYPIENYDGNVLKIYNDKPSLIVKDFELSKDYNILETINLGKVYQVNVKLLSSSDNFVLTSKMKLIKNDNNIEKIINVVDDNTIYYKGNIEKYEVINLVQDIYINKKVISGNMTYFYFNINDIYINDSNVAIIIDGLQYGVNVDFNEKKIIFNNNNDIIGLINTREKYRLVCNLRIESFTDMNSFMLDITLEDELNTTENLYIDTLVDNIIQYSLTNFRLVSPIEFPSKITHRIEKDIYDKLEYNDINEMNKKILVLNTDNKYLNKKSKIRINDTLYYIYEDEINYYIMVDKTFDIDSIISLEIVNDYQFNLNIDSERYYSIEGKVLDININTINYQYIDDSGTFITIEKSNIINNELELESSNNTITIYENISIDNNIINTDFNNVVNLTNGKFIEDKYFGTINYLGSKKIYRTIKPTSDPTGDIIITDDNTFKIIQENEYSIKGNNIYIIIDDNISNYKYNDSIIEEIFIENEFIVNKNELGHNNIWTNLDEIIELIDYTFIYEPDNIVENVSYGDMKINYLNTDINNITISEENLIDIDKFNIFKELKLYINNEIIDTINPNIMKTMYNYHMTDSMKKSFDMMTRLDDRGDYFYIYSPLMFYFYNKPHLYLPLISLVNSNIRLEGIVSHDCHITLDNELILLDTEERYKFGTYGHEYLIERYIDYKDYNLDEGINVTKIPINGIIKNIYLSTTDSNNDSVKTIENIDYDVLLNKYYNEIKENSYIINMINNILELNNDTILLNNVNVAYTLLKNSDKLKDIIDYRMIIYVLLKYTKYFNDKTKISNYMMDVIKILLNIKITSKIETFEYIKTMNIKCNGDSLFNKHDGLYFNSVTSYNKLNSAIPKGNYFMTFSLSPEESNPSGHLNFNIFEECVVITDVNKMEMKTVLLNVITKEYNILRIVSGMGCLAWKE